jgi:hypothetical protein
MVSRKSEMKQHYIWLVMYSIIKWCYSANILCYLLSSRAIFEEEYFMNSFRLHGTIFISEKVDQTQPAD